MPFSYVQFMTELMAPQPYPRQPVFAPPRLAPLREDISQSTIGIFTSAGLNFAVILLWPRPTISRIVSSIARLLIRI